MDRCRAYYLICSCTDFQMQRGAMWKTYCMERAALCCSWRVIGRHGCRYIHLHTSNIEQNCPLISICCYLWSTTLILTVQLCFNWATPDDPLYYTNNPSTTVTFPLLLSHTLYYYHTPSTTLTPPLLLSHPLRYSPSASITITILHSSYFVYLF